MSNEMPWKIFEGCWHSFHLSCLNNVLSVCPICRQGVGDAIRSLATTANRSVQVQQIAEVDGDDSSSRVENTANDNDDDNEVLTSPVEANVDQVLPNLTLLVVDRALQHVDTIPRDRALRPPNNGQSNREVIPLILTYNPSNRHVKNILSRNFDL